MIYKVYIDWDATDWTDTPDFSQAEDDITSYVENYYIERGKNNELGNVQAGTLDLTLDNRSGDFSPGGFAGRIRVWLPVCLKMTISATEIAFSGFISKIRIDPHPEEMKAYLYCTDGMDLLARQLITQDGETREVCNDGRAIEKILNASGWLGNRSLDKDAGEIVKYPACSEW
jgi:hypothetical protein